jgi:endo-1,4-beta-xylanase
MKTFLSCTFFLFSFLSIHAQDDYHIYLNNFLQNDYSLPTGEWVFYDNENSINQNALSYGGNFSIQNAAGEAFDQKVSCVIGSSGNNPWDAAWKISNTSNIQSGDKLLAVFYIRSVGNSGEVNFFIEDNETYLKEVYLQLTVTEEWRRYIVPFESMGTYPFNDCGWGFHLANMAQHIEIGGFTAINYGDAVALSSLPSALNNQFYGGYEDDAPWRAEAAARIEQIRKAELSVAVQNTNGEAVEDAAITVNMLRHNFDFGSAVVATRLANNPNYDAIYESKIINLDGEGHGFNTVVFENDLKWDAWEEQWYVNKPQLQDAVAWLKNNELKIRGHNLVWPGSQYLPEDVPANYNNIPYLQNRIDEHLEEIMLYPGIGPEIHDWDVLNEVTTNQDLANAFAASPDYETGRELYVEIFEKARELDPDVGLWLNDYVTMSINSDPEDELYIRFKQYASELVNSSVDVTGIGFQGHIGGFPNSIYEVLATLDDFHNSFGTKAKITEFDLPTFVDEELAANYLRDFLTAIYSHESTDGFLFWSFWDGQTYMNAGANLYREDWSETPAHAAFVDLLFNEWWTEENLSTNVDGQTSASVFKGLYEISYACEGTLIRDTVNIVEAVDYEIVCDDIASSIRPLPHSTTLHIFPNPSNGILQLERGTSQKASIRVYDALGRVHLNTVIEGSKTVLDLTPLSGIYFLEYRTDGDLSINKVVIR